MGSYVYQNGKTCSLRLTIKPPESEEVVIGDALPGDVATCNAKKKIAGKYQRGNSYEFLKVDDGYYIGHGEYWWALVIALTGLIPYCYLVFSVIRSKKSQVGV
jgi:hypothetical protein